MIPVQPKLPPDLCHDVAPADSWARLQSPQTFPHTYFFRRNPPNVLDVTVSTHWHNDLLGRETLLADIVGSFIHSWPIFSLSSRKVNPLCSPLLLPLFVLYLLDYAVTDLWVDAYATRCTDVFCAD